MKNGSGGCVSPLTINLENGIAENMGGGMFVAFQWHSERIGKGGARSVVVSFQDLEAMLSLESPSLRLEEGTADYEGGGLWCVSQEGGSVSLSEEDLKTMWCASQDHREKLLAAE